MSSKTRSIIAVVENMNITSAEAAELVRDLQRKYGLSSETAKPAVSEPDQSEPAHQPQPSSRVVPLEILYENGDCENKVIAGKIPIGVVINVNNGFRWFGVKRLILYWKEFITREKSEIDSLKQQLPQGYRWHLLSTPECRIIKNAVDSVNQTLWAINGDELGKHNYATSDSHPYLGYTRYVARLD